jgi:hypothetical protein
MATTVTSNVWCDFCRNEPSVWMLPATAARMDGVNGKPREAGTLPVGQHGWCACDACAGLIEADDRAALVKRAYDGIAVPYPTPAVRSLNLAARNRAERMVEMFWTARVNTPRVPLVAEGTVSSEDAVPKEEAEATSLDQAGSAKARRRDAAFIRYRETMLARFPNRDQTYLLSDFLAGWEASALEAQSRDQRRTS